MADTTGAAGWATGAPTAAGGEGGAETGGSVAFSGGLTGAAGRLARGLGWGDTGAVTVSTGVALRSTEGAGAICLVGDGTTGDTKKAAIAVISVRGGATVLSDKKAKAPCTAMTANSAGPMRRE